ncbi:lichenicidin A2 family type 2 lantibiotic [Paenibacillus profundus]|uniref:Lichenicidin A2 family type 2 lantibiotic n=1 Tax=Paenibacillus profundus TaxID=1173085 RepID=A0ABS8YTR7_9BACL|nr:lichenicidin A2 family type 2 lantibiotic [Paenibacillus profundus]MCE5173034.1 lichenicidin A2 family type 2 lantibiotic [Paenibacillus profundus]
MSNEQIISLWKNPELRNKASAMPSHPSGTSFQELSVEEMSNLYGAGEVKPMSSLACGVLISFVGSYLASAAFKC